MKYSPSLLLLSFLGQTQSAPFSQPLPTEQICSFDDANPLALDKRQSSGISKATTWNPPANLVKPLNEVWQHQLKTYGGGGALAFKNYGYDQVIAAKGKINYCVRWDSSKTVTAAQMKQVEQALKREFPKWTDVLTGFDGWPYSKVEVKVVGWAVRNKNQIQGSTSGYDIYTTKDAEGKPQCDPKCGRFFNQNGNYPNCPGGTARHYDQSLWLTDGFKGGAGGDWGQRVGTEYFMGGLSSSNLHVFLHEVGHTFALDDFYDWTPSGVSSFIMKAGSAQRITEFDAWMTRDWWRHLKSRYNLGSAGSKSSGSSASRAVAAPASGSTASKQNAAPKQNSRPATQNNGNADTRARLREAFRQFAS